MSNFQKITRIKKKSTGQEYIPYPLNFQTALDTAEQQANTATQAAVTAVRAVKSTQEIIGGYLIPWFDSTQNYSQYDLVLYQQSGDDEPKLFRALVNITAGPWNQSNWIQTSYYQELINSVNIETIRVGLKYAADASPIANKTVKVVIGSTATNYTTDSNGYVVFTAPFGSTYTVIAPNVEGYVTPKSVSKVANSNTRYINFAYRLYTTQLWVIKSNGDEVAMSLWNVADNTYARILKLETSAGNCCIKVNNQIGSNKQWASINLQFPSLPNLNQSEATADYDGAGNTDKMEADYAILKTTNPTLTISAVTYCREDTVEIDGVTYHGFLPAAGQLVAVKNNIYDINAALDTLGGNQLAITSGTWWSSSQYSGTSVWLLYNGSLNNNSKHLQYSVLPFFDF